MFETDMINLRVEILKRKVNEVIHGKHYEDAIDFLSRISTPQLTEYFDGNVTLIKDFHKNINNMVGDSGLFREDLIPIINEYLDFVELCLSPF